MQEVTGDARSSSSSRGVPGLPGFYAVPGDVGGRAPGTLLKWESVPVPGVEGAVHRVMYTSSDERGRSVAVSGLVFVPAAPPPRGGYPIVSWAHGTNGMASQCAPSLDPSTALPSPAFLNALLERGWAVAASDLQGQGTPPGLLPYLVGGVAARNTVDIVAAARQLPSAHVGRRYWVWGHSEGGHSALFAWRLAAPGASRAGLDLLGAVASAPPSHFHYLFQTLRRTPYRLYLYMALAGINVAYGDGCAPLDQVLTPRGMALLSVLRQGCLETVGPVLDRYRWEELVHRDPFTHRAWRRLLLRNDPGMFTGGSEVPLLVVHGGADEQIPAVTSAVLARHLGDLSGRVERWVYPGASHGGVVDVSFDDVVAWLGNRLASRRPTPPRTRAHGVRVVEREWAAASGARAANCSATKASR